MKIEEIYLSNEKYPKRLKEIYNPPKKIYVLGNVEILNDIGIAIVGARKATEYGKKVALKLSEDLSKRKIVIISGLAKGIDSYAHIGTLNVQNGRTIAVLGSGIKEIYPKENIELARQIIRNGGCLISEYSPDEKPNKINFPERNRIISALSKGVIVVEASEKSGALITADLALEQGREVFSVPGDIYSRTSVGTNKLIQQGAKLVTSFEDVLEEIY